MLWAFHRLSYDNKRKISKEEYGEARRILQKLWKSEKTITHKEKISISMKGNINNSTRVFKGMKSDMTQEGKNKISKIVKERQIGNKQWFKGPYSLEYLSGEIITELSLPDLSKRTGISISTLQYRVKKHNNKFIKGFKVYNS
jgi:hypothetical protein